MGIIIRTTKKHTPTTVLMCLLFFTVIMHLFSTNLLAEEKPRMTISYLTDVLRAINNPVCDKAADDLLAVNDSSEYDLHLRDAGLNLSEVTLIAKAIETVHRKGGPWLRSFSLSYNQNIGDEAVLILTETLPPTVTEIGLVQSGIGDKSANALIGWAEDAPYLHWLCVEKNTFSDTVKKKFVQLGENKNGLLVVQ